MRPSGSSGSRRRKPRRKSKRFNGSWPRRRTIAVASSATYPASTRCELRNFLQANGKTISISLGCSSKDEMIGCADLLRGYRAESIAMLGLLLLAEGHQHRGIGAQCYAEVERVAGSWPELSIIRSAIIATNELVIPFWRQRGFLDAGVRTPHRSGEVRSGSIVLEKRLICYGCW
jgi:GNAT superfamily N-acetyltransferase